jgi:methyl-accepting chemotaxis protein
MNNMSLVKRITIDILLAVLICVIPVGIFSYVLHRSAIIEENALKAQNIAHTVSAALDIEQYKEIMSTGVTNDYYDSYKRFLDNTVRGSTIKYLYVLDKNYDSDVTYFAEGYILGYTDDEEILFGEKEPVEYHDDELFETLRTGIGQTSDIYDLGDFGRMVSGFSPILDSSGQVLGVVGVDIAIEDVMDAVDRFAIYMIIIVAVAFVIVTLISIKVCQVTFRPLKHMAGALDNIGLKGDLTITSDAVQSVKTCSAWGNEIGTCAKAVGNMLEHLTALEGILISVANGDLSVDVDVLSDRDAMGNAIAAMIAQQNETFAGVKAGAAQVSIGSRQIADGSQSVASGSSEQSASIVQLSDTIKSLTERTARNVEMAKQAEKLSGTVMTDAKKGNEQMEQMLVAMNEINNASRDIEKVISVIDSIAFQTNILALNASVEAARAGQHGKGFAVVAEEVRNLAGKSAEAAKDTGALITSSMEKAELGSHIAGETSESLQRIVTGIEESAGIVSEIARISGEQAVSIDEINKGVAHVAESIQQNSAAAQESAAASEEMSGQAETLDGLIAQFKLKDRVSGKLRLSGRDAAVGH